MNVHSRSQLLSGLLMANANSYDAAVMYEFLSFQAKRTLLKPYDEEVLLNCVPLATTILFIEKSAQLLVTVEVLMPMQAARSVE